jgi:hypothetical protein
MASNSEDDSELGARISLQVLGLYFLLSASVPQLDVITCVRWKWFGESFACLSHILKTEHFGIAMKGRDVHDNIVLLECGRGCV